MASRTRTCRACGDRFTVQRYDQAHCRTCGDARRDVDLIETCLHSSPGQTVDWVAIATGVRPDRIRELAAGGLLGAVPVGAEFPAACVCLPGDSGRCSYCRSRLAVRFMEATYDASKPAVEPSRGLRLRRRA